MPATFPASAGTAHAQVVQALAAVLTLDGLPSHLAEWTPREQAARAAVLRRGGDFSNARDAAWVVRLARAADDVLAALAGRMRSGRLELEPSEVTEQVADAHWITDHHHEPHCAGCGATPDRAGEDQGRWARRHVAEVTAALLTRPVALAKAS